MDFRIVNVALVAFGLALPGICLGAGPRFGLSVESGIGWQNSNEVASPTLIDARTLNPTNGAIFRARFGWRPSERHEISVLLAPLSTAQGFKLPVDTTFMGTPFVAGEYVDVRTGVDCYRLSYGYLISDSEVWAIHVGAAVNFRNLNVSLHQGSSVGRYLSLTVLPLLSADARYSFAPGWFLSAGMEGLAVSAGGIVDGALTAGRNWDGLSFSGGLRYFGTKTEVASLSHRESFLAWIFGFAADW